VIKKSVKKIFFLSPGPTSKGGISAVVENYRKSNIWKSVKCIHYGSCALSENFILKNIYSLFKLMCFPIRIFLFRPQIISVHCSSGGSFYRKSGYILIAKVFFRKVVLHVHPTHFVDFYLKRGFLVKHFINFILRLCTKVIFLTKESAVFFRNIIHDLDTDIVPNPVDCNYFKSNLTKVFRANYEILYLGWIIPEKGVFDIVDVLPEIITEFPNVNFIFAGNKQIERLESEIIQRKLGQYTQVLGWVDGPRKKELLLNSRMLLLPTYSEGIPNVLLEAMASKLPAITTPVGGIPSVFEEGINGLFISPGNKSELVAAILKLLRDDNLCAEISASTYHNAISKFDIEIVGDKLYLIYSDLI